MSLKIFGVYGLLGVVLLLAGCSLEGDSAPPPKTVTTHTVVRDAYSFEVKTVDGRSIPCVWIYNGLSCDWDKK